jgi:hypothetical protein
VCLAITSEVRATRGDETRGVTAVAWCVAEALAALVLQKALRSHVRLHRHPQTTDVGDRAHLGHLRARWHGLYEVWSAGTFFSWILFAASGSELHDSLNVNVQGLQVLPDDALGLPPTEVLNK